MATTADLLALDFRLSEVSATRVNIEHPDPLGLGPFCRLKVVTEAPEGRSSCQSIGLTLASMKAISSAPSPYLA